MVQQIQNNRIRTLEWQDVNVEPRNILQTRIEKSAFKCHQLHADLLCAD